MEEIGMSIAIFIIALIAMVGTILRIIANCISAVAYITYFISNSCAKVYLVITDRRANKTVKAKH